MAIKTVSYYSITLIYSEYHTYKPALMLLSFTSVASGGFPSRESVVVTDVIASDSWGTCVCLKFTYPTAVFA